MRVFVRNMRGEALMPCNVRKARILLKEKKAKIVTYNPFTIQLTMATGESVQPITIGIDTGAKNIGFAIESNNKILAKGEIELRQDVKDNLDTRRMCRRTRRNRKTRYRQARFLNRTSSKKVGWLPPSIENRIQHHFRWIDKLCSLVPNPKLNIEVGKFDVAKMINPDIQGVDYQHGQCYGYHEERYFVFARDNYTCQVCGKKDKILRTHHIIYRSMGGSDRVDNLITVCTDCHTFDNHKKGHILYKWAISNKKPKLYKEPPFMNTLRKRIFKKYPNSQITYGSITTPARKELGLEKTHYNDAIAITSIQKIKENPNNYLKIVQFRKKKRILHDQNPRKGGKKGKNTTQYRYNQNIKSIKGWYPNDRVRIYGKIGYITGFSGTSVCYVKDIQGNFIRQEGKKYNNLNIKCLEFLNHNNNWKMQVIPCSTSEEKNKDER